MTKFFSSFAPKFATVLALSIAMPLTGANAEVISVEPSVFEDTGAEEVNWLARLTPPSNVDPNRPPIVIQESLGWSDPFNPLPGQQPLSRTRFEVTVTDERTTCPRIWGPLDCPVVIHADGSREGIMIQNYTHTGMRQITVERIEYSAGVAAFDAYPIHHVAVDD